MATQSELVRERKLLAGLGVPPVRIWPARCMWYGPDGSVKGTLPCDPYSRLLYLGRGLRPDVGSVQQMKAERAKVASTKDTLVDALIAMMQDRETWEGTASELLSTLKTRTGTAESLPVDATRMSKALTKLASTLATNGINVEAKRRGKNRGIRLDAKRVDSMSIPVTLVP